MVVCLQVLETSERVKTGNLTFHSQCSRVNGRERDNEIEILRI